MRTLKTNTSAKRLAILLSKNEKLFHIDDLANFWLIKNKNSLRVTLKRYVESGLLYRIYRGFYSVVPIEQLDSVLLGTRALHDFCYLTTETILYQESYIGQKIDYYTFVSEKSLRFNIGTRQFVSRKLNNNFLYNPHEIILKEGLKRATVERAVADLLYFNPKYHFDRPINWEKVMSIQQTIGYPLTPKRYDFAKTK